MLYRSSFELLLSFRYKSGIFSEGNINVKFSISQQQNDFGNKSDFTLKEPPSRDRDRFFISDFFFDLPGRRMGRGGPIPRLGTPQHLPRDRWRDNLATDRGHGLDPGKCAGNSNWPAATALHFNRWDPTRGRGRRGRGRGRAGGRETVGQGRPIEEEASQPRWELDRSWVS